MVDFTAFLIAAGPVAIGITKLVDLVRSFDTNDTWPKGLWIAAAMVLGVGAALLTGSNFADLIVGVRPEVAAALTGTAGEIVTGLAIGGTASLWHEALDRASSQAKATG